MGHFLFLVTYVAGAVRKAGSLLYYFAGDCNDPAVQEQIKKNFIAIFKQSLFKQMCTDPQMKERCNVTNVDVECGVTSRGRRSIWEGNLPFMPVINRSKHHPALITR